MFAARVLDMERFIELWQLVEQIRPGSQLDPSLLHAQLQAAVPKFLHLHAYAVSCSLSCYFCLCSQGMTGTPLGLEQGPSQQSADQVRSGRVVTKSGLQFHVDPDPDAKRVGFGRVCRFNRGLLNGNSHGQQIKLQSVQSCISTVQTQPTSFWRWQCHWVLLRYCTSPTLTLVGVQHPLPSTALLRTGSPTALDVYGALQIALLSQDLQLDEVHCAELLLYAHEQVKSMVINLCLALTAWLPGSSPAAHPSTAEVV